jgi:hypothetical protein
MFVALGMTTCISHSEVLWTAFGAAIQENVPGRLGLILSSGEHSAGHNICTSYSRERNASDNYLCLFVHVSELKT